MDIKKLRKVGADLDRLRRQSANIKAKDLIAVALKLGRREVTGRGIHRMFVTDVISGAFPIGIPDHGKPLNKHTAVHIIGLLEQELQTLLELAESQ